MSVKKLREAFNAAAEGKYTCSSATMGYERAHDVEWQRLAFSGTAADGTAFTTQSELIPAKADVFQAAADTAKALIEKGKPAP